MKHAVVLKWQAYTACKQPGFDWVTLKHDKSTTYKAWIAL
jgi:hypothetical protein